jgi:hypothetical protein
MEGSNAMPPPKPIQLSLLNEDHDFTQVFLITGLQKADYVKRLDAGRQRRSAFEFKYDHGVSQRQVASD